jgi:uncharacterized protein YodC (DUF2158 family)
MLKLGDVVRLKSGGMKMTVNGIQKNLFEEGKIKSFKCVWFDEESKLQELIIQSVDAVELVTE